MAKAKKADSEPKAPKSNPAVETPLKQITAKATWSGFLSAFSLMSIPVKSYKATDTDKIERHSFHSAACLNRIQQNTKVVCSGCGVEVDKDQTVKGVEVDGKVVLVCDEEMKAHQPAKDDVLEISEYVPQDAINPKYYESSEYLACSAEGTSLKQIFANFRGGLVRTNRVAIGRIINRGHQYSVAIRPEGQHGLIMSYLFAEYEVRDCNKWEALVEDDGAEIFAGLMESSDSAKDKFTPAPYDPVLAAQRKMIAKKAAGETVEAPKAAEAPKAQPDVMAAMKEMLKQAKAKKAAAGK